MPEKKTIEKALKARREGKAPTTQAGEFVREEIEHIRKGKHGARSPEQAIAIGLSKARRAGVDLPPPKKGTTSEETRKRAERDLTAGRKKATKKIAAKRSASRTQALKRESRSAASPKQLSEHAKRAAATRERRGKTRAGGKRTQSKAK
jgi:hypothetical protein